MHDEPADFYRCPKIDEMHISMGNADAAGEILEAERVDLVAIAHMTVGHDADTSEALMDRRLHFAEEGADAGGQVQILEHHHARFRNFQSILPKFVPGDGARGRLFGGKA